MTDLSATARLKRLCREKEIDLKEGDKGHFIIHGPAHIVHYWPTSKKRTAWIEGSRQGKPDVNVTQAVNLAVIGKFRY